MSARKARKSMQTPQAPRTPRCEANGVGAPAAKRWPPALWFWKTRLPAIAAPVLAGLRGLASSPALVGGGDAFLPTELQALLLFAVTAATGHFRLPFSVVWWLVLVAAQALQTSFLLAVATVLSLSVLLGWYGVQLLRPHAISALWGGDGRSDICGSLAAPLGIPRPCWRAWDFFVHGLPGVLMLHWHAPPFAAAAAAAVVVAATAVAALSRAGDSAAADASPGASADTPALVGLAAAGGAAAAAAMAATVSAPDGATMLATGGGGSEGVITVAAALASLPLNGIWLWGLGVGQRRCWPWTLRPEQSNEVYGIFPALPPRAWAWVYVSHWAVCAMWAVCLALPRECLLLYGVYALFGFIRMPFTNAWWITFLLALFGGHGIVTPLFEAVVWFVAASVPIGFYAAQVAYPHIFPSLVDAWAVRPVERYAPKWMASRWVAASKTWTFGLAARVGDLFLHVLPTISALWLYRSRVTAFAAMVSLPCNLIYWVAYSCVSGASTFADTNWIYGLEPNMSNRSWMAIFGTHWAICAVGLCCCPLLA